MGFRPDPVGYPAGTNRKSSELSGQISADQALQENEEDTEKTEAVSGSNEDEGNNKLTEAQIS